MKPYEIEVMIAEVGDTPDDTMLFRVQFDGTLGTFEKFGAMGGGEEDLASLLAERYETGADLNTALSIAAAVLEEVGERELQGNEWEAAVLDRNRGRRKFRRLIADDIAGARVG